LSGSHSKILVISEPAVAQEAARLLILAGLKPIIPRSGAREEASLANTVAVIDLGCADAAELPWEDHADTAVLLARDLAEMRGALAKGARSCLLKDASWMPLLPGAVRKAMEALSERRRRLQAEGAIGRLERNQGIAMLAGGVAHDFNNILAIILGNSRLLLESSPLTEAQKDSIGNISEAGRHGRALAEQLMSLDAERAQPAESDLSQVLRRTGSLLQKSMLNGVSLQLDIPSEPLRAKISSAELIRILLNLCINACDAMPKGGKLHIHATRSNTHALLQVADSGCGMGEQQLERIFEPYYSTKDGKGTGLGLTSVRSLVRSHGGEIEVESEPGKGTRFKIRLPLAGRREGSPWILLVEIAHQERQRMSSLLRDCGYQVLAAPDAGRASDMVGTRSPQVLVVDVLAPGGGPSVYRELKERIPGLRVLYTAAFGNTEEHQGHPLLSGPATAPRLIAKIQKLL
jgi:two-component system, cell cycle sensor histidine kinase and response regulator CckA